MKYFGHFLLTITLYHPPLPLIGSFPPKKPPSYNHVFFWWPNDFNYVCLQKHG